MAQKQRRVRTRLFPIVICSLITPLFLNGCSGFQARSSFEEANALSSRGDYSASLSKYERIIEEYPANGDRVLFEMGIIYAHPKNGQRDYQKALECFQKIITAYPGSGYRKDSEMMTFYINNVAVKDETIAAQQTRIETLTHEAESRVSEIGALQKKIKELEQKVFVLATQKGSADRILIEKKERRMTLLSKGEVLKTYRIALGGNPNGPKERQGDNKTPEGTYSIDSRNKDSRYHLSLHISYPNERDRKRAKELGVSPGGNIMIHGIKNGFSWVGDAHTEVDWTKGCIAVTDEEIEEIAKVAPNGTTVEIRP
ncbi:L,D-transpeptidase family protein [Geobacter pickeringii]|uniref:Peptidase n=1 Tax=Geobacter pickeringii TaxID=345632 RepID=A0A0B5B6R5_9BACT|nr:L,D-transpeptidase family protein [Geobacter pickeringii]AJE02233.1 peptidase [Geobacter pickeringii]